MEGLQMGMKRKAMTFQKNRFQNYLSLQDYLSRSDMLMLLDLHIQQNGREPQEAYGECEACEVLTEPLKWVDNKWVCEICAARVG